MAGEPRDLTPLIDSDDFRDAHERAMRGHILDGPDDHICYDLCSEAIIDRLVGKEPLHEYPSSEASGKPLGIGASAEARAKSVAALIARTATPAAPEPGLDVERLKAALAAVVSSPASLRRLKPSPDAFHTTARLIAAEYAALWRGT